MIQDVRDFAEREWTAWFPGATARDIRCAIIARGAAYPRRAVVAVFDGADREPRATIKIALGDKGTFLERECDALAELRRIAPRTLCSTMPVPLGLDWIGDSRIAAFSALPGRQVNLPSFLGSGGRLAVWRTERLLGRIMEWAASLRNVTPASAGVRVRTDELHKRFIALPGNRRAAARALHVLEEHIDSGVQQLHRCWQHGDLAVGNVLVDSSGVHIVDWECAADDYEPWFDQAYALAAMLFQAWSQNPRANLPELTRQVLDDRGWVGGLMRRTAAAHWRFPLPIGVGVATACMRTAVRSHANDRSGWERWQEMAGALLSGTSWRGGEWLWCPQPAQAP